MKLTFSISIALAFVLSTSVSAQTRGVGAGGLVLDDYTGHTITAQTPQNPSAEWTAWQTSGLTNLTWYVPTPPASGAQAGFVFSGPLTGTVVPQLAYWVPPGQAGFHNNGGYAGAWDYATESQLGIGGGGGFTPSYLNAYASASQTVAISAAVVFASIPFSAGFTTTSTTFTVTATGIYNVEFTVTPVGVSDFAITVNGTVAPNCAFGCATGTTVIHGNAILSLTAGDVLQLINNNSPAAVTLTPEVAASTSASITAIRIQ